MTDFGPWLAEDTGILIPGASGSIYARSQYGVWTTAKSVTDLLDNPLGSVTSNARGIIERFRTSDDERVVYWKSGDSVVEIISGSGVVEDLDGYRSDVATASESSAQSAAAAASSAQAAIDAAVAPTDAAVDAGIDRAVADGRIVPGAGDWADINNKPTTFPPTTGTTSDVAAPGNHNHDGSYYTKAQFPAQVHASGSNWFYIDGYDSPRVHPKTGLALDSGDVVVWGCFASDPDPTNSTATDFRADKADPPTQPVLTIPSAGTKYDPVSSLTTRNLVLPTFTTGQSVYVTVPVPGSTNKAVLTGAVGAKFVEVSAPAVAGIHGYLFVYENVDGADSGATIAVESTDASDVPLALRIAAAAWVVGGDIPTAATVDGYSSSESASTTSRATGTRTSGTDTAEFAVIFRTGNIGGNLVTLPDGTWTKVVEAYDASTNGGGSAVMVAHNGLTTSAASTAQGGDTFTWTNANSVVAETVAIKGV